MWRPISIGFVTVATHSGLAAQLVLMPGALLGDCRSALRVGVVTCGDRIGDFDNAQSVSEAQVTEFLAEYGKPPREAVRALLDPSDNNIAAWIRKQRQVTSIASYVAKRMTEMQSQLKAGLLDPAIPASQLPAMVQMRATLFLNAESASSQRVADALHQVVGRYPSLDARIVQVGPQTERQPLNWLVKLDTTLPVSSASLEAVNHLPLPSLLIEDLRYQTTQRLDAANVTAKQICDQIVALRSAAQTRSRLPAPIWPSP